MWPSAVAPSADTTPRTRQLDSLVSPLTGIVHELHETFAEPDDPRLASYSAEVAQTLGVTGHQVEPNAGSLHERAAEARAAALGEAAERYSASFVPDSLPIGTAEELGHEAAEPERFALFGQDQYEDEFPYRPFTRTTRVRWARGAALATGKSVLVPAQLIYLSGALAEGEVPIAYPTSSGLACGQTIEQATFTALLELLERDAFMLTWNARLTLPLLDASDDPDICRFGRVYLAPTGLPVRVVDMSQIHGVPTALALVRGSDHDPVALAVGAACAPSIQEAWKKAVSEAFAVRAWARSLRLQFPDRRFSPGFRDVVSFEDRVLLHALAENVGYASFLDNSTKARRLRSVPDVEGTETEEQLRAIVSRLYRNGIDIYAVDVTAPDIRNAGLHVIRVVATDLCMLDVPHRARYLGGRRLYEVPVELGLRPEPLLPDDVNPYPHPFP